ncbi:MAG TPA: FUSC family protein [Actinocrinis sp.]|nr:FUSC family protein [Actinocrinis sp.]
MSTYSETVRELRSPGRIAQAPRSALAPARGIRLAVGVVLPLTLGVCLGHYEYGVYAALGALPSGFAAMVGEERKKPAAVALASAGMALGTFVGALAANAPIPLILFIAAFAYAAGLVGAFSDRVAIAALQWPGALLIATSTPDTPRQAAVRAGLVLVGGLFQSALVALALPKPTDTASATRRPRRSLREFNGHFAATVRAHIGISTPHGQHALRLALTAATAQSAALLLGLAHPYWAALTAVLVLKTEHVLTVRRALDRIGGTAIGILLGLPLAALAHFGPAALLLGAGVAIALGYTVFPASYFLYSVFLTGFVVVLLDLLGFGAGQTALPRLLATLLGGVIALVASHARPS